MKCLICKQGETCFMTSPKRIRWFMFERSGESQEARQRRKFCENGYAS